MFDATTLQALDLKGLSKGAVTELAAALLAQLSAQLSAQHAALQAKDEHIARRDCEIRFKDTKIERITVELARLKAWKFGARTERMNAEQRQMFEETAAEDEASLQAQLEALQGASAPRALPAEGSKRRPRRQPLPEQLRRVEHRHEPEKTTCPSPGCGQAMVRGKWACKCCQVLVQEPAEPQIIDKGMPTAGLLAAHTLVSRFVDHLPYYRQERAHPLWEELHVWMRLERTRVADGGGITAALDYSLKRWDALGRFLHDGEVSIDNNHIERLMRPWAMGRKAWLFAGSELAGQRAAMVMSLVQSAKLNGHDPWAYLKDVLERLLAHPNSRIEELLPHRWQAVSS